MSKQKSLWATVVDFFREKNLLEKVSRQELLDSLYGKNRLRETRRYRSYYQTVDVYRRYLTAAGYLERISNGMYMKVIEIPKGIKKGEVVKEAYGGRETFNMRKESYEKSRRLEEERMRKRSISIDKLKDRYLYKIDARTSEIGIWVEEMGSFLISRFKTGNNFLFDENHYDLSDGFGTAWPMEEIEKVPVEVPKPFSYHSEEFEENEEQIMFYLNKKLREMDLLSEYGKQILKR